VIPHSAPDVRADHIAAIAHELHDSLCVIRNAARLLGLPVGPAAMEGARLLIERHSAQMSRHLDDLLDSHPDTRQKT
jgi:nitrogen-specific signal transduction histidine kinase